MCLPPCTALGVDNAVVEVDGPEVPIMDGSAAPFVAAIDQAGIVGLPAARRYIQVLKPVRVAKGDSYGELRPHLRGLRIETEIEFDHPLIGRQSFAHRRRARCVPPRAWRGRALSASCATWRSCGARATRSAPRSRTPLWSPKIASSIRRVCAFPTNSCAIRRSTRSATWRCPARRSFGAYRSVRGGHKLNHAVLTALMADRDRLGLRRNAGSRRPRGHADLAGRLCQPRLRAGRLLIPDPLTFTP